MTDSSSDPEYLEKQFKAAQSRYRQVGAGGVLESDKDNVKEPEDAQKKFDEARRKFNQTKGNVVTMGNKNFTKTAPGSTVKVFGIHPQPKGEK